MTDTQTAPYNLSDDSWDNAKALALAARIRLGSRAEAGLGKLLRYAEGMVRRLIMVMAAGLKLRANPTYPARPKTAATRELEALIAEVNAALRAGAATHTRPPEAQTPPPPRFKWRARTAPERGDEDDAPAESEAPETRPASEPAFARRIEALMAAIANPAPYARKAAIWLAQQKAVKAPVNTRPFSEIDHWTNALTQLIVQVEMRQPALQDSS